MKLIKFLLGSVLLLGFVLIGLAMYGGGNPQAGFHNLVYYSSCRKPQLYRVDFVDPKFNLSTQEFTNDVNKAAEIWNNAYGTDLFAADPKGTLSVNLVFDERQSLTNEILTHESNLKKQKGSLDPEISDYERRVASFKNKLADLNSRIEQWNSQGGAPPDEYEKLKNEQQDLKTEADNLNQLARKLNQSTNSYNTEVTELNQTISTFNQKLQFRPEEGLYEGKENKITIYFNVSRNELVHTLAHEFGHALGLGHAASPEAIMFSRTNQKMTLTSEDLQALDEVCKERNLWEILKDRIEIVDRLYLNRQF